MQSSVAFHAHLLDFIFFCWRSDGASFGGLRPTGNSRPVLRLQRVVLVLELCITSLEVFYVLLVLLFLLLVYRSTELLILTLEHSQLFFETRPLFQMLPCLLLLAAKLPFDFFHIALHVLVVGVQHGKLSS